MEGAKIKFSSLRGWASEDLRIKTESGDVTDMTPHFPEDPLALGTTLLEGGEDDTGTTEEEVHYLVWDRTSGRDRTSGQMTNLLPSRVRISGQHRTSGGPDIRWLPDIRSVSESGSACLVGRTC